MKYFYHFLSRLQLRWNICIATKFSLKADVQIFARKRVISRKKYVAVEYVNFYKRERERVCRYFKNKIMLRTETIVIMRYCFRKF